MNMSLYSEAFFFADSPVIFGRTRDVVDHEIKHQGEVLPIASDVLEAAEGRVHHVVPHRRKTAVGRRREKRKICTLRRLGKVFLQIPVISGKSLPRLSAYVISMIFVVLLQFLAPPSAMSPFSGRRMTLWYGFGDGSAGRENRWGAIRQQHFITRRQAAELRRTMRSYVRSERFRRRLCGIGDDVAVTGLYSRRSPSQRTL
jgi:hypothetical protein